MPASPFLSGNFAPVPDEIVADGLAVTGHLPESLRGTLYRNGPNPHVPPAEPYHWFTGDGMIHALRIASGQASYRNRWVRTPRFLAEAAAGRPLFAGFGQPLVAEAAALDTGVANTHVLAHAGQLLALEEAHPPTRIDPGDLGTVGPADLGGAATGRFTAHPKRDPSTGQMVFFCYDADGVLGPAMAWGTVEANGRVSRHERFEAPFCSMVHDFAVTATQVVIPVLPLTGSAARAAAGGPPFAWEPDRRGTLGVLRRDAGVASLRWQPCPPGFFFHVLNAFDVDGAIAMDVVEYDAAPFFPRADGGPAEAGASRLVRWRVDPAGRVPVGQEVLSRLPGEFPRVDERFAGLPYRHGYRVGPAAESGRDTIIHHDLLERRDATFVLADGERASEAVFVPAGPGAAEAEGWLLTVVWQPATGGSVAMVLDAQAVAAGPVATIHLPRRVPFGFHGSWVDAAA